MIRTYSELKRITTFEDRFNYLKLNGVVGRETFGVDRYLNQVFYKSKIWRQTRDFVIVRDNGCDLALDGYDISDGLIIIHHMNPITIEDVIENSDVLLDPEFLICTTLTTHNAIHYGDINLVARMPIERRKNDTCPWK